MYKSSDLKRVHIEISTHCQASCPMCARNFNGGELNSKLEPKHMTFNEFVTVLPSLFVRQLEEVSFCGNYGDPLMNPELDEMVKYLKLHNKDIFVDFHTNASARSSDWWINFAELLPKNHLVHFGIDGLEDTHSLYRVGTDFNKIMLNARNFIGNGGKANWTFIKFKHNENQLEEVKQLAYEYGFKGFQEKQTSRFMGSEKFEVVNKKGNTTHFLEQPTEAVIKFIPKETIDNYKEILKDVVISCQVEKELNIYVDVHGDVYPCCWVGSIPYTHYTELTIGKNYLEENNSMYEELRLKQGDISAFNRPLTTIVDSIKWQSAWQEKTLLTCSKVCGKNTTSQQFIQFDSFQ